MSVPMDWMYKRPTVDTEAYLLGKPIDRSLEQLENPNGCPTSAEDIGGKPGALFVEAAASAALEAEAKLRQDPLYIIRKKEEEQRRMLLNNPVRLKKLQEELEKKKRIEEKKSKTSNDKDILAKMMKLKAKYGKDITDILSEDVSFKSDDSHRHRRKHQDTGRRRNQSRSRSTSPNMHRKKEHMHSDSQHHRRSRSRSRSSDRKRRSSPVRSSQRSSSNRNSSQSPLRHSKLHGRSKKPEKESSRSPHRFVKPTSSLQPKKMANVPERKPRSAATSGRFDPAELERKRLEMMTDAKVREDERAKNLTEYRQKDKADEERDKRVATGSSGGFIRPMLESAAAESTLESRLKTNRHKSQRTRADLDKNFTQR